MVDRHFSASVCQGKSRNHHFRPHFLAQGQARETQSWLNSADSLGLTWDFHMHFIDLTLPTVAANLAVEEALLEEAEEGKWPHEYLRIWHSREVFAVIGRGSKFLQEVNVSACEDAGIKSGRVRYHEHCVPVQHTEEKKR